MSIGRRSSGPYDPARSVPDVPDGTFRRSLTSPLDSLTPLERDRLIRLTRRMDLVRGTTICRQGDPSDALYLIERGVIQVQRTGPDGHARTYAYLCPPDCAGEAALLGRPSRAATLRAVDDVTVRALTRAAFEQFAAAEPGGAVRFLREVARRLLERLEANNESTEDVLFRRSAARVAAALVRVARDHGEPTQAGVRVRLGLSHAALGELAGVSRETVCRTLRSWQKSGLVEQRNRAIVIRDLAGLRRMVPDA